jgi:hypothetical protein
MIVNVKKTEVYVWLSKGMFRGLKTKIAEHEEHETKFRRFGKECVNGNPTNLLPLLHLSIIRKSLFRASL